MTEPVRTLSRCSTGWICPISSGNPSTNRSSPTNETSFNSARSFRRVLVAAAIVLDEVDRLGIRDMEMMEMMSFMTDPEKQDELKGMFDVHSEPIQEVAAKLSDINWKTYRKVYQVLPAQRHRSSGTVFP